MKNLTTYINEMLNLNNIAEANVNEGKVTDEKSFREMAEAKFKNAFGDELDEDKMNKTIDGILNDNKDLVDAGDWGALTGILNKSF
jgi:hypothetical protein